MEQKSNGSRFIKSHKLDNVCYDIRGEVLDKAIQMERNGIKILRLNTGNPGAFGFDAPDELLCDLVGNIHNAVGYSDSQGIFPARKAIQQYYQTRGVFNVGIDDIFIGNGVSELILLSMQALLNEGDEILIPSPDYPLWTAAVVLNGGKAVHYRCDEASDWYPDIEDIRKKITSKTKGILVINPNNPTGAVYPADLISLDEWTLGYKGTMLEGSVTFEGLYDDETLVRLSFHDVKVRVRSEESGREYTHTLSGSASFRRNDIGAKPDYPYADLSVNGASKEVEMDGLWIVDFDRSDPDFIQTEFEFKDGGYERRFYIQIDKYVNKDPQELVGVNLGDCSYAVVTDVRTNSEVSMKDCCKGGSVSIIEIEKPPYMYMYPDITFEFDNLAVQIAGQVYYINGTAKAVYTFKLDKS